MRWNRSELAVGLRIKDSQSPSVLKSFWLNSVQTCFSHFKDFEVGKRCEKLRDYEGNVRTKQGNFDDILIASTRHVHSGDCDVLGVIVIEKNSCQHARVKFGETFNYKVAVDLDIL